MWSKMVGDFVSEYAVLPRDRPTTVFEIGIIKITVGTYGICGTTSEVVVTHNYSLFATTKQNHK
jgi:hypothetical protein